MNPLEIKITYDPSKNDIELVGPLNNKALCYVMLGLALEKVIKYEPSKILIPLSPLNG